MKKIVEVLLLSAICIIMILGIYINPNYVLVFSLFLSLSLLIKDKITLFIKVALLFIMFIPTEIYILPTGMDGIFGKITFVTCFALVYIAMFYLFFDNRLKYRVLDSRIQIIFLAFVLYACCITFLFRGVVGIPLILNNFVVPFVLFKLIYEKLNVGSVKEILDFFIIIGIISAMYGLVERILQFNYLYDFIFHTFPWYLDKTSMGSYRIFSTIGHPLQVNVVYLSTLGVLPFSKFKNNIVMNCILVLAVIVTGSRTGMALAIAFVFIRVIFEVFLSGESSPGGGNIMKKIILFTLPVILLAGAYKMGVFDYTLSRFEGGAESTAVRTTAFNYITSHYNLYILGKGMKASYDIAKSFFGANHFFENCWISLFIDLGIIGLVLYLSLIIAISFMHVPLFGKSYKKSKEADVPVKGRFSGENFNMVIFILLFIISISSFDSISLLCNLNYIFFIFTALINLVLSRSNGSITNESCTSEKSLLNTGYFANQDILNGGL